MPQKIKVPRNTVSRAAAWPPCRLLLCPRASLFSRSATCCGANAELRRNRDAFGFAQGLKPFSDTGQAGGLLGSGGGAR